MSPAGMTRSPPPLLPIPALLLLLLLLPLLPQAGDAGGVADREVSEAVFEGHERVLLEKENEHQLEGACACSPNDISAGISTGVVGCHVNTVISSALHNQTSPGISICYISNTEGCSNATKSYLFPGAFWVPCQGDSTRVNRINERLSVLSKEERRMLNKKLLRLAKTGSENSTTEDDIIDLLDRGAEPNYCDRVFNRSILHWASSSIVAAAVIEAGADVNARDVDKKIPLHTTRNAKVLKQLILAGSSVNAEDKDGRTPIYNAAFVGSLDMAKLLVYAGAMVNITDSSGETPMHRAASGDVSSPSVDPLPVVRFFTTQGVDVNVKDNDGETPLHEAAKWEAILVAKYLIKQGANIHAKDKTGQTPIFGAATDGSLTMVEFLATAGADVNATNDLGQTLLHEATIADSLPVVSFLISKGLDVNAKDNGGRTPLHYVANFGSVSVAQFLIEHGADVDAKNGVGNTPLLEAVSSPGESIPMVELLVVSGANVTIKNNHGETPLHHAAGTGDIEMVKYLLTEGALSKIKDTDGNRAYNVICNGFLAYCPSNVEDKLKTLLL